MGGGEGGREGGTLCEWGRGGRDYVSGGGEEREGGREGLCEWGEGREGGTM